MNLDIDELYALVQVLPHCKPCINEIIGGEHCDCPRKLALDILENASLKETEDNE